MYNGGSGVYGDTVEVVTVSEICDVSVSIDTLYQRYISLSHQLSWLVKWCLKEMHLCCLVVSWTVVIVKLWFQLKEKGR